MNDVAPIEPSASVDILGALDDYGVDIAALAAVRAFARVVPRSEFSAAFGECLARLLSPTAGGGSVEAEALFCEALAANDEWHSPVEWFARVQSAWSDCLEAGTGSEFALKACAALVSAGAMKLTGERSVVYQLELDIMLALNGFSWCVAALLMEQVTRRDAELRLRMNEWDALTGLPNRRRHVHLLEEWLNTTSEDARLGLIVFAMDWGVAVQHLPLAERDRLRLAVSERLREVVRPGDMLSVTGEHEWSLLLPAMRSPAQIRLAANKLLAACESLLDGEFRQLCGRLSAGGAVGPEHGEDASSLEHAARTALLIARRNDQRFEDYRADFADTVDEFVDFERELLNAIHLQQLELHLQPQIRLDNGRCESAELLLRWQRSPGVWVPPPAIVDGAQRLGVLHKLSRWLVMHAARMAEKLDRAGVPIRVNLNLTAIDLRDEELPDLVEQALATWRVPPERFGLEVTETALVSDHDIAAQLIRRLRKLGCPVALDDFGTGFSSLAYLRNLPVTELKIDQMFVRQLCESRPDQAIVDAIMRLANGFGLQVVAEGVEDADARTLLQGAGCHLMQGFLESAAMPLEDFVAWWHRRHDADDQAPPAQD